MDSVTVAHAKSHLSEMIEKVQNGGALIITRRGKPIATLQPIARPKQEIDLARVDAIRRKLPRAKTSAMNLIREIRNEGG